MASEPVVASPAPAAKMREPYRIPGCRWQLWNEIKSPERQIRDYRLWTRDGLWVGGVNLLKAPEAFYLRKIWVMPKYRGQGYGTRILESVLATYADTEIRLWVEGDSDGPLSNDDLRAWYGRHGFVDDQIDPEFLIRPVRGVESD